VHSIVALGLGKTVPPVPAVALPERKKPKIVSHSSKTKEKSDVLPVLLPRIGDDLALKTYDCYQPFFNKDETTCIPDDDPEWNGIEDTDTL
jgi:hypothetical protein